MGGWWLKMATRIVAKVVICLRAAVVDIQSRFHNQKYSKVFEEKNQEGRVRLEVATEIERRREIRVQLSKGQGWALIEARRIS